MADYPDRPAVPDRIERGYKLLRADLEEMLGDAHSHAEAVGDTVLDEAATAAETAADALVGARIEEVELAAAVDASTKATAAADGASDALDAAMETVATTEELASGGPAARLRSIRLKLTDGPEEYLAAMDRLHAAGGGCLMVPKYIDCGDIAPRTDRGGNAVLPLPGARLVDGEVEVSGASLITILGVDDGSLIVSDLTGQAYSSEFGPPSILGGPTTEQLGANATFSACQIRIERVTAQAPANPTISGIDLSRMANAQLDNVIARGATFGVESTHYTFGVRLPEGLNGGRNDIGRVEAQNYYAGVVANSAHVAAHTIFAYHCVVGLAMTGNTQVTGNDGHSAYISRLLTQACVHHIASYSPTAGAISLPAGKPAQLVIAQWDFEDAPSGWAQTVNHVLDANHQLYMKAAYNRVIGFVGLTSGPLTITGGLNLELQDLSSRKRYFDPLWWSESGERWAKISTPATVAGGVQWLTGSAVRWRLRKDATAETGTNNGGNLAFEMFADNGVDKIAEHLLIRKSARVVLGGPVTFKRRVYSASGELSTNDHIVAVSGYSAPVDLVAPSSSGHGAEIIFKDEGNGAGTYPLRFVCAGSDKLTGGVLTTVTLGSNGAAWTGYTDATGRWHTRSTFGTVTFS